MEEKLYLFIEKYVYLVQLSIVEETGQMSSDIRNWTFPISTIKKSMPWITSSQRLWRNYI